MLPDGVELRALTPHRDDRGVFTELHRASWGTGLELAQWNAVRSEGNVLRGMHVHLGHTDYLTLVSGRAVIGLYDLRPESSTAGLGADVGLDADTPAAIVIPPGVAHGFFFTEPAVHVYAMSSEWSPLRDLGCRYDDPALGIAWPGENPLLSERDERLGPLSELLDAWQRASAPASA